MAQPKYREDAKGQVSNLMADCTDAMRNEIRYGDAFCATWEDCETAQEYTDILTHKELATCFKRACAKEMEAA